jgi:hypothetical protein
MKYSGVIINISSDSEYYGEIIDKKELETYLDKYEKFLFNKLGIEVNERKVCQNYEVVSIPENLENNFDYNELDQEIANNWIEFSNLGNITIEEVANNLNNLTGDYKNFDEDVIENFEDYNYEGETNIIVTHDNNQILAYANKKDSPKLKIYVKTTKNNEYTITSIDILY